MNRFIKIFFFFTVVVFLLSSMVFSSSDKIIHLFQIGRSKDKNVIKYDLNLTSEGKINTENPLNIYWIKHTDGGKVEGLSFIQSNLAYGVKYVSKTTDEVIFHFVSYPSRQIIIRKFKGNYYAFTTNNSKAVSLKKIHVQIDGGTFMIPKISYVKLFTNDILENKELIETIKP